VSLRDAVDAFLTGEATSAAAEVARMRASVAGAAGVAASLPSGAQYVEGIRAEDAERAARLDKRRTA